MRLAPRATATWWARRHWDTEVTLRVLAIAFTKRTWRDERAQVAQQIEDLGDLKHTIAETRAAATWDLRTLNWDDEREARKRATALVLQTIERAWVVKHRDKPLPPMPRVISGGRTPRGVAVEVEWPGGGHAGVIEELQAELASVWHVDATTGVVVDRTGRPGNRAGVALNYADPFTARVRSPLITEEDDDAEDAQ